MVNKYSPFSLDYIDEETEQDAQPGYIMDHRTNKPIITIAAGHSLLAFKILDFMVALGVDPDTGEELGS